MKHKNHPHPIAAPQTALAERLEHVRELADAGTVKDFHELLMDGAPEDWSVSYSAVRNYHFGERDAPVDYLLRVLDVLPDIRPAWLLTGEGPPETPPLFTEHPWSAFCNDLLEAMMPGQGRDWYRNWAKVSADGIPLWTGVLRNVAHRTGMDAVQLGRVLRAPLDAAGLAPESLDGRLNDYVLAMSPVLISFASEG